jgi:hypothetical protein
MDIINSTILLMLEIAFEVLSIYLLFWFILEYLLRLVKNDGLYYQLSFYIPQIRNIVWVFYISYLFLILIDYQLIFGSIVLICFLIIKWKYLKSFFYGMFFKIQKGNVVGQYIKLKDKSGMIHDLKNSRMDLELSNGDILQYPYHLLINEPISLPVLGKLNKISILIDVETEDKTAYLLNVKKQILLNPYVVSPNKVRLDFIEDKKGKEKLKVVVYTCEEIYVSRITDYIRSIN